MKKTITFIIMFVGIAILSACSLTNENKEQAKALVPPISVQLWSVREAVKEDFEGTLTKLSALGFKGVEFAGNYGKYANDPEGLKAFLSSLGLQASGVHLGVDKLQDDVLAKNLTFVKKLGAELVIIPMDSRAWHPEGVKDLVKELNELAKKLAKVGLRIGYHNHAQEFQDYNNSTFWDYIAQNTTPDVFLQMDAGWINYAGKDPVDYLKRYPYRTLTTHIKVRTHKGSGQSPIVGEDGYDWTNHVKHNISIGGTRWLVVEQEEYPAGLTPLQAVAKSKLGLDKAISKL